MSRHAEPNQQQQMRVRMCVGQELGAAPHWLHEGYLYKATWGLPIRSHIGLVHRKGPGSPHIKGPGTNKAPRGQGPEQRPGLTRVGPGCICLQVLNLSKRKYPSNKTRLPFDVCTTNLILRHLDLREAAKFLECFAKAMGEVFWVVDTSLCGWAAGNCSSNL